MRPYRYIHDGIILQPYIHTCSLTLTLSSLMFIYLSSHSFLAFFFYFPLSLSLCLSSLSMFLSLLFCSLVLPYSISHPFTVNLFLFFILYLILTTPYPPSHSHCSPSSRPPIVPFTLTHKNSLTLHSLSLSLPLPDLSWKSILLSVEKTFGLTLVSMRLLSFTHCY